MRLLILTYHYFRDGKPYRGTGIKPEDFHYLISLESVKARCAQIMGFSKGIIKPAQLDNDQFWSEEGHKIIVTIDDGHQSADEAAEIFLAHGIKPILFVIPDRVGREFYLNWDQLRDLSDKGCSVQSHTVSHLKLTGLSPDDLSYQLGQSKKIIEDKIGKPVNMLAAPMGRINRNVIQKSVDLGYKTIMTSFTGINNSINDLIFMRRFQVKQNNMELPLKRYFSWYSRVRLEGASKNFIKKLIG